MLTKVQIQSPRLTLISLFDSAYSLSLNRTCPGETSATPFSASFGSASANAPSPYARQRTKTTTHRWRTGHFFAFSKASVRNLR
jgi:hypothetical protein